jgi:diaminopimelate decarboxylase
MKVAEIFFDLVPHFPELAYLDLGGGFKVPYKEEEEGTDVPLLGEEVGKFMQKVKETYPHDFEVWFEPGKFIVSECGYFITQVNVLKQSGSTTFAGVNSGFNHLIRPMFYESYHRIVNISNPDAPKHTYTITGNICETDTFASDRPISEIHEGDLLACSIMQVPMALKWVVITIPALNRHRFWLSKAKRISSGEGMFGKICCSNQVEIIEL